jgi:hypothetical protein
VDDYKYIKKGSLVRLFYDYGENPWNIGRSSSPLGKLQGGDPRYNPGVVVDTKQYAVTVIWSGVADPETWASEVLELLS